MIAVPAGARTEIIGKYVAEKTGISLVPGMFQAFMVVNDQNDLVGGVVITNFRGTDCEMSGVSETSMAWRPHVCSAILTYIFKQLGCVRVTCITTKGNKRARRFIEHLGFQLEGNVRLGYDGKRDALIYGLLRSECRHLAAEGGPSDGQEVRTSSTAAARSSGDSASANASEPAGGDAAGELEPDQSGYARGEPYVLH